MINNDITLQETVSSSVGDMMVIISLPVGPTMQPKTVGQRMAGKCTSECYGSDPASLY